MPVLFEHIFSFFSSQKDDQSSLVRVLELALDRYSLGKVFFDAQGRLIYANRKAYEFIPILKDEKRGGKAFRLPLFIDYLYDHAVECDESLKNALGQASGDDAIINFREVIALEGGALCLVEAKKLDDQHTLFVLTDISREKEREDSLIFLNKNNLRLQKAMQYTNNGILVSDPKVAGNPFIFVNSALCEFFDLNSEDVLGRSWDILPAILKNEKISTTLIQAVVLAKESEMELSVKKNDQVRWFDLKMSTVKDSQGRYDLQVGVFTETTLLKLREAEAYQAQKLEALGKLAGGVAHDFNNVLSIIDGFSIMAAKSMAPETPAYQYLQKIQSAAKRGATLTNKMLTFSRHKVVSRNVIDLSALIEDQKVLLDPLVTASINFSVRAGERDLRVSGSTDSIAQILMNLVINARDAMPNGGTLSVGLQSSGRSELPEKLRDRLPDKRFACLSVSDTGLGMDQKTIEKIFDPFFTTKPQGKGTGLGLSIVYGLVQEMGGGVHVDSCRGEGTTFHVYLPLSEAPVSKALSRHDGDPSSIKLKGYTILVAEDEPDLLQIVCEMLEQMEATVIPASNGNDALVRQDEYEGDIDILLTDVVMPELNGVKLASLLTSLRPSTKVVFMSGYPGRGDMAPIEVPENVIFIPKPIDYAVLASTLHDLLQGEKPDMLSGSPEQVPSYWVSHSGKIH